MTREILKDLLPIMQAFVEGKVIEYYNEDLKAWTISNNLILDGSYNYRIKPEPKYRPFKTKEECWTEMHKHHDFGWVLRSGVYLHILSLYKDALYIQEEDDAIYFDNAFNELTFTDGTPFGLKEE